MNATTPVILETGEETTLDAIRAEHPGWMIAPGSILTTRGYDWLVETPRPEGNYQRGPNALVNGKWEMTWESYTPDLSIPEEVTRRQARRALHAAGLLEQVEAQIAQLPEPQKTAVLIDWQDALIFKRSDPTFVMLATALGLSSAQLDQLFLAASQYE